MEKTTVNESNGKTYFVLPKSIMQKQKLKPIMAGTMGSKNNRIFIKNFEKTVKVEFDFEKDTLKRLREIMKEEGYGSLDETLSNVVHKVFTNPDEHIVYLYPQDFFESGLDLLEDFGNSKGRKTHRGGKRKV